ncbi:hypothetical protein SNL152K_9148 [Streptomyces sp. NL15-2K]|nr:hypothetical protein SNL152K_9148 [Streptomyces sp. NL15-2K]
MNLHDVPVARVKGWKGPRTAATNRERFASVRGRKQAVFRPAAQNRLHSVGPWSDAE